MKRFIQLIAIGAALTGSAALADAGTGTGRSDRSTPAKTDATMHVRHECQSDCCARHVTGQPGDVSREQRDREGWGGAG